MRVKSRYSDFDTPRPDASAPNAHTEASNTESNIRMCSLPQPQQRLKVVVVAIDERRVDLGPGCRPIPEIRIARCRVEEPERPGEVSRRPPVDITHVEPALAAPATNTAARMYENRPLPFNVIIMLSPNFLLPNL